MRGDSRVGKVGVGLREAGSGMRVFASLPKIPAQAGIHGASSKLVVS